MRRPGHRAALAVSALLHAALVLLWWQTGQAPARRATPVPRMAVVRLLPRTETAAATAPPAPHLATARPRRATVPTVERMSVITVPARTETPRNVEAPTPSEYSLDLALHPQPSASAPRSMVDAALNDPRSNTRRNASERLAAALSTQRTEEPIADGMRVRQGARCVLVHDSHVDALDPFTQGLRLVPKLTESCR